MKNSIIIIFVLFFLILLSGFKCSKDDYTVMNVVKLNATISDTNEIIHLGDTLKIRLVLPTFLNAVDSYGNSNNVAINSLQEAFYAIRFNKFDSITKRTTVLWGNTANNFTTVGSTDGFSVYTTTINPYSSVLNIVAPSKGIYTLEVSHTPGHIKANNGYKANLITNFAVANKHWANFAVYFNGPNQPDFITSVTQTNADGFGFYCFRVN